jgi:hypothetical protein
MTDRRIGIGCLGLLATAAVLLLLTFMVAMVGGFGVLEIFWRLLTGFASFLRVNLPRISADAGTWGPGLAAFGLALVVGHFFLRGWAKRRNRAWSAGSTLCAGLVLPLLFAISFLVPGVLLQVELLGKTRWFSRERGKTMVVYHMRNLHLAAWSKTLDEPGGKFPDWPEDLTPDELKDWNALALTDRENGRPPEPPIYLGRWLTVDSDGSLPLLISPSYSKNGAKVRQVFTMGSELVEIRDEEVDAWIDKAMAAGKR